MTVITVCVCIQAASDEAKKAELEALVNVSSYFNYVRTSISVVECLLYEGREAFT